MSRIQLGLMIVCFALVVPATAADNRPVVAVRVSVPQVFANAAISRSDVESRVAKEAADFLAGRFRFVRWDPAASPQPPQIELTLVEKSFGPLKTYRLQLTAVSQVGRQALSLKDPVLYDVGDTLPRDWQTLETALKMRVASELTIDFLQKDIHDQLLRKIPLAQNLTVNKQDQGIVLPLDWDQIKKGSILSAQWTAKSGANFVDGNAELHAASRIRPQDAATSFVLCRLLMFNWSNVTVKGPMDGNYEWKDDVERPFADGVLEKTSLQIFMKEYSRNSPPEHADHTLLVPPTPTPE